MKAGKKLILLLVLSAFLFSACCKKEIKKQAVVPPQPKKVEKQVAVEKSKPVVEKPKPVEKPKMEVKEVKPAPKPKPTLPTFHVVKKGECLWIIASYKEIYNDPFMWPLIYRANKDKIRDPDLIFPKQVFKIPRDYTEEEKKDAIHFAKTRGPWSLWDGK